MDVTVRLDVLEETLSRINNQIEEIDYQAKMSGCESHELRFRDGSYPMIPLLLAKAQVLALIPRSEAPPLMMPTRKMCDGP